MARLKLSFSMSLDGFIAGAEVRVDQPMDREGERLHEWLFDAEAQQGVDGDVAREAIASAGAVILGKHTFDLGIGTWADTPYPVPSFVLTHERRDDLEMKSGTFVFVTDGIESALRQARAAAGERDIVVMGANVARQYLKAGLVDVITLQLVPVLLGSGTRLFDGLSPDPITLSTPRICASPFVTHMEFKTASRPAQ